MRLFTVATLTPVALLWLAAMYGGWWIVAAVVFLSVLTATLDEMVHHITPPTSEAEFPAAARLSTLLGLAHFGVLALVVDALANQPMGGQRRLDCSSRRVSFLARSAIRTRMN